jgi:hypothetical protein
VTYVEGGARASLTVKFGISANLIKACWAGGASVAVGLIASGVCALLGMSGLGSALIGAVAGFATSIITSIINDTKGKNVRNMYFTKTVSVWSPIKYSKTINLGLLGW